MHFLASLVFFVLFLAGKEAQMVQCDLRRLSEAWLEHESGHYVTEERAERV
jgi:hypothetical protein